MHQLCHSQEPFLPLLNCRFFHLWTSCEQCELSLPNTEADHAAVTDNSCRTAELGPQLELRHTASRKGKGCLREQQSHLSSPPTCLKTRQELCSGGPCLSQQQFSTILLLWEGVVPKPALFWSPVENTSGKKNPFLSELTAYFHPEGKNTYILPYTIALWTVRLRKYVFNFKWKFIL